ncbi:protease complex subunit PrcB family protein [Flavobacterium sp. N1736]|uniref:protease complex subunit PrcB family protein n=1 Tax=Flavobacterium sp. N1736 TaxID=2986823 RepID=UPI002224D8BC|nr:protease complex subunit PrcB family protein [Flavobacterium sp. N1736]
MKKLMLGLFIAFGISACSLNNDDFNTDCGTDVVVPFTGFPLLCNYSVKTLPNNPLAVLVKTQTDLDANFTKHANTCPVATDPNIDFTKNYLVGIFAGVKPTSGYEIKMTSMVENMCEIVINFYEKSPQAGEQISQTPTYPSDFILIPVTSKPIIFNRTTESPDNIIIGNIGTTRNFFQLNDFNILKFQDVAADSYSFEQYKYTNVTKRNEYTSFLAIVPQDILTIKGQTKTYGTPDAAGQGGVYFQLRQAGTITKIYIDNNDTEDQSSAVKLFKKSIQDKITSLK